jgi:hypothetical protein
MTTAKAYLYSHNGKDYACDKWDYGLLKQIFEKYNVDQIKTTKIPESEKAIVVIPGPETAGYENKLSKELQKISRVILFVNGDESASFDIEKISHPNIEVWFQYPHDKHKKYNKMFIGAPEHIKKYLPPYPQKKNDFYFAGQINHDRRKEFAAVMPKLSNSIYKPTKGFAQGEGHEQYYKTMSESKIIPCPSGARVIDSFRFFEAIEMLCLPIGDLKNPEGIEKDFFVFVDQEENPIIKINDWHKLENMSEDLLNNYLKNMHQVVCWWLKYKRKLGIKIMEQLNAH